MEDSIVRAEELARIGRENSLAEIEYEDSDVRIHICFDAPQQVMTSVAPMVSAVAAAPAAAPASAPLAPASSANTKSSGASSKNTIKSPLAGVFYRAPSPEADPFVAAGDQVPEGQTLCIVEAMKLMNEIAAERPCKIADILVENGEAVEEGQPLFVIE